MDKSYSKIYNNFQKFINKINNKKLDNFWIISDRSDFKPLKDNDNNIITKTSNITHLLHNKFDYYINKKFINIKIKFNSILIQKFKNLQNWNKFEFNKIKDKGIFIIKFNIFIISDPIIPNNFSNNIKFCNVKYNINDLFNITLKFKSIEVLLRFILDKNIFTSLDEHINYSDIKIK
jgi:hypothetical protein